ncbi:C-type lectin 37Da-like [Contarinia nasturtii]|uniref:C-type lectin 37Da-like n=1 Tax=Contarinia nasturtii TaxID=265458 RepID=UPI0012D447F8|nr:C-type lectin 37Da-like [Contarinia nasturtii]
MTMKLCLLMIVTLISIEFAAAKGYSIVWEKKTWLDAYNYCDGYNMRLVSIESRRKLDEVVDVIQSNGLNTRYIWTSGTNLDSYNEKYFWATTNKEVTFNENWANGQPDNYGGQQNCMILDRYRNYQFDDANCYINKFNFICEEKY